MHYIKDRKEGKARGRLLGGGVRGRGKIPIKISVRIYESAK
jgi:hypothetical protein